MDILNNLNVDGKIKGLGEVEDGSGNKLSDLPGKMDDSQLVTSWQATPDDTHVPSEKLTKDSLDGKVDKLVTKPTAGTYTSVTINAEGQVTGGSNPTTLAGYGITDAVTLGTEQTITGDKTFIKNVVTNNSTYSVSRDVDLSAITSSTLIGQLSISAKNGDADLEMARFQARRYGSRSRVQMQCANLTGEIASLYLQSYDNLSGTVTHISAQKERTLMVTNTDGTAVYTAPDQRAYNSANTTDIVTIGSLASNPNVVHTTGNETIGGYKTFNNSIWKTHANLTYGKPSADFSIDLFSIRDPLDTSIQMTALYITYKTDGSVVLNGITRKSDGTYNTAVDIATLRSAY